MKRDVILTGLRANGELHLGNYLGGILPIVNLQKEHAGKYQVNMFVPDLHSFTTPIDHDNLYRQTIDNLKVFAAAGLDTNNPDTFIYRQSFIPAHSELAWILSCFTGFGELSRQTQFKDKSTSGEASISAGLFNYPVLMAADILLYDAKYIPVGEDQRQHLELARDLAIRINNKFGDILTVPETWDKQIEFAKRGAGSRIRSLRNPEKKMSKSIDDPAGTILLSDEPAAAAKKVMSATTDSVGTVSYDIKNQPGISNLLQLEALLNGLSLDEVTSKWQGNSSYGDLKSTVAESVSSFLTNFQAKLSEVSEDQLLDQLTSGEQAMGLQAEKTLHKVQQAVGLRSAK